MCVCAIYAPACVCVRVFGAVGLKIAQATAAFSHFSCSAADDDDDFSVLLPAQRPLHLLPPPPVNQTGLNLWPKI